MTENQNYVDPNSGAAAQPGGFAAAPLLVEQDAEPTVEQDDEPTDVGADTASLDDLQPAGNARRDDWVQYARGKDAPDDELASQDEGGLSRDELRAKYGA